MKLTTIVLILSVVLLVLLAFTGGYFLGKSKFVPNLNPITSTNQGNTNPLPAYQPTNPVNYAELYTKVSNFSKLPFIFVQDKDKITASVYTRTASTTLKPWLEEKKNSLIVGYSVCGRVLADYTRQQAFGPFSLGIWGTYNTIETNRRFDFGINTGLTW